MVVGRRRFFVDSIARLAAVVINQSGRLRRSGFCLLLRCDVLAKSAHDGLVQRPLIFIRDFLEFGAKVRRKTQGVDGGLTRHNGSIQRLAPFGLREV